MIVVGVSMRYAGVLAILLLAGCSHHWSASQGPLVYPQPVGYDEGASARTTRGGAVDAPVLLLTDHDRAHDCHPALVKHGSANWLYFSSDRDGGGFNIYRKRLDSRAVERLTDLEGDEYWPRVSADCRWLCFGGNTSGHWDIYILDLDRVGPPQLLTPAEKQDCIQPAWASDGRELAYSAFSPTLDAWTIRGITFGDPSAGPDAASTDRRVLISAGGGNHAAGVNRHRDSIEGSGETVASCLKPVALPISEKADGAPVSLRSVQSHWTLNSAGNLPLTGLHPDYAPSVGWLAFQEYRKDGSGWYAVKLYEFASGLTTTLAPPRGYGAIQPRYSPDGTSLVYLTSAKAGARPESGDGFVITDLSGNVVQDIRNPCGRGEVSDPALVTVDGKLRLIFSWADGDAESLCWITLP